MTSHPVCMMHSHLPPTHTPSLSYIVQDSNRDFTKPHTQNKTKQKPEQAQEGVGSLIPTAPPRTRQCSKGCAKIHQQARVCRVHIGRELASFTGWPSTWHRTGHNCVQKPSHRITVLAPSRAHCRINDSHARNLARTRTSSTGGGRWTRQVTHALDVCACFPRLRSKTGRDIIATHSHV